MPIWGNRDKEQSAEEPSAGVEQESGPPNEAAVDNGEPAPAFWRAQGHQPAPASERVPTDTPGQGNEQVPAETPDRAGSPAPGGPAPGGRRVPAETMPPRGPADETMEPAEVPAPAMTESPAGTDAPAPVLTEEAVVLDEETVVKDPAMTQAAAHDPAAAEAAHEPAAAEVPPSAAPHVADAAPGTSGSMPPQRWSEILAMFVDDPRGSVKMAADAVDSAISELVASARARQQALALSWQEGGTDTEQLRTVLREYRRLGAQIQQMSPAGPDGRQKAAAR